MGTGAVLFWPEQVPPFDPEKALAFAAAIAVWCFTEFFQLFPAERAAAPEHSAKQLIAHDDALGKRIYGIAGEEHICFLRDHDFGASWRKEWMDPTYELSHELQKVASEFEDAELQAQILQVRDSTNRLAHKIAYGAWPLGTGEVFSMIPDLDSGSGQWSDATIKRVAEANALADELADRLGDLYRLLRRKGVMLIDAAVSA
jgi:hypothetical protein